ncbi:unnamed protein product [Leptidea sinapis]|uniref:non-specific serine/threonine protein kinase n=1 Tax=Leptidea sinapis TaxID=189913 RepID=A0A5E4QB28_9NEOP|nr:unnamed protein product [Leptidea sinapis]
MSFPKIEGYVVTEKLGSGSYSTVYKAYTKVGARSVLAIKCIDKAVVKHSGSAVDNLVTEIRLLKKLTHPHIVQMRDFTWDDRTAAEEIYPSTSSGTAACPRNRCGAHGPKATQPAAAQGLRREVRVEAGGLRVRTASDPGRRQRGLALGARLPAVHGARDAERHLRRQGRPVECGFPQTRTSHPAARTFSRGCCSTTPTPGSHTKNYSRTPTSIWSTCRRKRTTTKE